MSRARDEAARKVATTRQLLVDAGVAGELELFRWPARSSGVMTRWHLGGTRQQLLVAADYPKRIPTLCGLEFFSQGSGLVSVTIFPEFDIPQDVLDNVCGTCLLLGVKPVRPGQHSGRGVRSCTYAPRDDSGPSPDFQRRVAVTSLPGSASQERSRVPSPVRSWASRHELNRPSWRQVCSHEWPLLVVTAMLAYAGCWIAVAGLAAVVVAIFALGLRRPQ